uniref:Uncharacterized protein n=1 Tax=viral metagenome TaxID=1070528 RepID=A0A6C0LWV6_9ZZZZ
MPELDVILKSLEKKVSDLSDVNLSSPTISKDGYFEKLKSKINLKILVYGSIPLFIIIILALWKPSFVRKEQEDSEMLDNKISFKKFSKVVIISSIILYGLLFVFLKQKQIKL